jgi:DNA repair exonuclease SbcCD nuclease subunit
MSNWPFRFVHAADFHLESPCSGVAEIPDHLRDVFLESAWWSAERVFETALSERVDFVVLSGGLVHPLRTGPRGPLFLAEHFARLAEQKIPVYWAGGREDAPEAWPAEIPLPSNVCHFPSGQVGTWRFERDGVPLVHLVGASRSPERKHRAGEFPPDPGGLFSIAVVHGSVRAEALRDRPIDYWALGGSDARTSLFTSPRMAHYPGTPQGRSPSQSGPHGCTLVEVDGQRHVRTTFFPCDALRWHVERVALEPDAARADLENRLHDRVLAVKESQPGIDLLISWNIAGFGRLHAELRRGTLAAELLEMLRAEYGHASPAVWSVSLYAEPPAVLPPEWYEQDTIRGDFLRELRRYQTDPEAPLGLEAYLGGEAPPGVPAEMLAWGDPAARERVLCEAALLGIDLLSGEGP